MWQSLRRARITWDNGLWWVMTDVRGHYLVKFAADNAKTVGVWNLGWTFLGMSHFFQQMKCLFMASFMFTLLFIYFIKPTSHPCHKWNIVHEEEPTYEQMKHMGILRIWKIGCLLPIVLGQPSSDSKAGGAWIGFPWILLCKLYPWKQAF
jgi:hypothetical protein